MPPQISSITKGPRQSNMELLRIIAMFMVMVLHADFWSLGSPSSEDYGLNYYGASTRTFFQCLSIISVNVFICISGWFGIKPSVKGICTFIFQFFFFGILLTTIGYIFNNRAINAEFIREIFLLGPHLWFVKAYLGLYILALPLNSFIENTNKHHYSIVLIGFFLFQTIYGILGGEQFILDGYSTFSFIGLYLLTRFCNLYLKKYFGILTISGGVLIFVNFLAVNFLLEDGSKSYFLLSYINPINILGAVSMVIWFSRRKIKPNKVINFIASSAFAVYLVHQAPQIGKPFYRPFFISLFDNYSGLQCLTMFALSLILIYLFSIILDQPRKWIWNIICDKFKHKSMS